ncbi:high affinity nitrate transporter 2.5 [Anopheles sinensis]|uniref:High affinity nitrate transporter 2.5 n=1 Tax=Anopheles sinensis TaxID=74873 RepID=A0A084VP66_ANOSI|nr:high affinity nitrate transporter 2.5 [Anopheles sinensis]
MMMFLPLNHGLSIARKWGKVKARRWRSSLFEIALFTLLTLTARPIFGQEDPQGFACIAMVVQEYL